MRTINELVEKWNSISPYTEGFLLVSGDHPLSFHIGYLNDAQKSFVVLNTGKIDKVSSSKAIKVENILLKDNTYALRFLLNYDSLDEIFTKLCWDLMAASKNVKDPVASLIEQYKKWLRLLHQVGNGLLSVPEQKGLIGELLFLTELIDKKGEQQALCDWVGPEGADQDFNFDQTWAEIKTTTISGTSIHVSSLQQLDRDEDGILVVYFLDKTTSAGSGTISLDEAVLNVVSKLTSESTKELFDLKIAKCGYQNKNAEEYSVIRFRLNEKRRYSVSRDFPRLTKDNTPASVIDAQYQLDLPSIEDFRISEA